MSEAVSTTIDDDPALESPFAQEMVRQMRAIDTYGSYDEWPAARVLSVLVLTKAMRREIPIIGDPDEVTVSRARAYYNAIAALIEARTGMMAATIVHLSHEGFGRALITVGKLIVVDKTLRDVHRFGFSELSRMTDEAERIVDRAAALVEAHRAVAKL